MTNQNLWKTEKRNIPIKKHLLVKRAKIIKFLKSEGYSGEDIAAMFNVHRSWISRILNEEKEYKGSVKNMLNN